MFVSCAELIGGAATGLDLAAGISQGLRQRASNLGRALRTSPSPSVRSYAGSQLRAAGQLARNPALSALRTVGRGLPVVGAGISYGSHLLDGDSQAEAIGGAAGSLAGGAAGATLGGAACGALAGTTFGLGAATCPVLIAGGGVLGGIVGDAIGSRVGGWLGRQDWF